jgi:hypothetical protein
VPARPAIATSLQRAINRPTADLTGEEDHLRARGDRYVRRARAGNDVRCLVLDWHDSLPWFSGSTPPREHCINKRAVPAGWRLMPAAGELPPPPIARHKQRAQRRRRRLRGKRVTAQPDHPMTTPENGLFVCAGIAGSSRSDQVSLPAGVGGQSDVGLSLRAFGSRRAHRQGCPAFRQAGEFSRFAARTSLG